MSNPELMSNLSYSLETFKSDKNWRFLYRMTLKIDVWPWKTLGHLSYAVSTFVHNFIANDEFKLELQSANTQFGPKLTIFLAACPWNLTDDLEEQQGTSSK